MSARQRGVIVNIVGQGGKVAGPFHLPGGSANAALMLASSGLAQALAPHGVWLEDKGASVSLHFREAPDPVTAEGDDDAKKAAQKALTQA